MPFILLALVTASAGEEIPIELAPERELGSRRPEYLRFEEFTWSTASPWFEKPAPVCRVIEKPMDLSRFAEEARKRGMVPNEDANIGEPGDGAFDFETTEPPWLGAGGNPRQRSFWFGAAKFREFERDEHQMAVVEPLATKEESLAICRGWMERLGIDEDQFSRQGDWPKGFEVDVSTGREIGFDPETDEKVIAPFGQKLRFVQQIGGLSAFWSGFGGNVMFEIADGGEFCGLVGCLRAWEKIGDYEVLDRAEIEVGVKDGFAWVHDPIDCERVEVRNVRLEAYHAKRDMAQKHFPLIYVLECRLHGGRNDGEEKSILLPALRQHRDRYGPPPEPTLPPDVPATAKPVDPKVYELEESAN